MSSGTKGSPPSDAESVRSLIPQFSTSKVIASEPPEWLSLNQRNRSSGGVPFTGKTYEEMVPFILGDTGITEARFKETSSKSLLDLHAEISRRDVNLKLDTTSNRPRIIDCFRYNAIGIVYDSRTWEGLHEIGRVVIESGRMTLHPEPLLQGCRETALRDKPMHVPGRIIHEDEPPIITYIRGMLQEPGIAVHELDTIPLTTSPPKVIPRESTMYVCADTYEDGTRKLIIRSHVASYKFGFDVAHQEDIRSLDDWPDVCTRVHRDGDLFLIEDEGVLLMYTVLPIKEDHELRFLKAKHKEHYNQ